MMLRSVVQNSFRVGVCLCAVSIWLASAPRLAAADETELLKLLKGFNAADSEFATTDDGNYAYYGLGNAFIETTEFRVDADAVGVFLTPATDTTTSAIRVVAIGNVLLARDRQSVRAETLFYDQRLQRVVITHARLRADLDFIARPPSFDREEAIAARDRWGGAASTIDFDPHHDAAHDEATHHDSTHHDSTHHAAGEHRGADVTSELSESRYEAPEHNHGRVVIAANELRGEHFDRLQATGVSVTTCDFGDPHWSVEAASALVERVAGNAEEGTTDAYTIDLDTTSLHFFDASIPFFPGAYWNTAWSEYFPLRSARYSNSSRFGQRVETLWSGQMLLPRAWRKAIDLGIRLEYLSDRGLGYGGEVEYGTKPNRWDETPHGFDIYGRATYYGIEDRGEDANDVVPETEDRGRTHAHQRIRTPWGMLIDAEYSRESDRGFLDEYFEAETRSQKPPENILYLRQPLGELSSVNLLVKTRESRYQNVVERTPEVSLLVVEKPIGAGIDLDLVGRASVLNFEPDTATGLDNRRNSRADLQTTIARTFGSSELFKIRPFFETRVTRWDDGLNDRATVDRFAAATGGVWGVHLSRVFPGDWGRYDALRHVIDPTVRYRLLFDNSKDPDALFRYDSTEDVRRMEVFTFGVRSYLYGRVAGSDPTAHADRSRSIAKLAEVDFQVDHFPEAARDNGGRLWGPIFGEVLLQAFPGITYYIDLAYDVETGPRFDEFHHGVRFVHAPTYTTAGIGTRYTRHVGHTLNGSWVWEPSDRYAFDVFYNYDFRREEVIDQYYSVVRNFHRWAMMVTLEIDEGEGDHVQFSVRFGPREFWRALKGSLRDQRTPY
ncbi:MAG: hypothetical protein AAF581_06490 [Planctomycetota bacterium]